MKRKPSETPDDVARRLFGDSSYQAKKRMLLSPAESQYIKSVDRERKRLKRTEPIDIEEQLDNIRDDINQKTHFAYICVSDL